MPSATIPISDATQQVLKQLAEQTGQSVNEVLDKSLDTYRHMLLLDRVGTGESTQNGHDSAQAPAMSCHGAVKGRLEKSRDDIAAFVLLPPYEDATISSTFPKEIYSQACEAVGRYVTLFGKLDFEVDRPFPIHVRVESLELHPADDELPDLESLRGTWKGSIGVMPVVDFVRKIRDE